MPPHGISDGLTWPERAATFGVVLVALVVGVVANFAANSIVLGGVLGLLVLTGGEAAIVRKARRRSSGT